MTNKEAIDIIKCLAWHTRPNEEDIDMAIKTLEQEPVLNKLRGEIADYGSIWVTYAITGRKDRDIEQLIKSVLKQAKEQVLDIIDKYRAEQEEQG